MVEVKNSTERYHKNESSRNFRQKERNDIDQKTNKTEAKYITKENKAVLTFLKG